MTRKQSVVLLNAAHRWFSDAIEQALALPENSITEVRHKRLLCREIRGRWCQLHRDRRKLVSLQ